jgi:UDP-sugar diphosphatase
VNPLRLKFELDGKRRVWDLVKCHDSVAIVLFNTDTQKLVFVKQFRPAVYAAGVLLKNQQPADFVAKSSHEDATAGNDPALGNTLKDVALSTSGYTLELCAGICGDKGADVTTKQTAVEEVLEETGFQVKEEDLQFVSSFRSGVGVTGSLQHVYYCPVRNDQKVAQGGGVHEESIEVVTLSPQLVKKYLLWSEDGAPATTSGRQKSEMSAEEAEAVDELKLISRPASMLFAITWFLYVHLPSKQDANGRLVA